MLAPLYVSIIKIENCLPNDEQSTSRLYFSGHFFVTHPNFSFSFNFLKKHYPADHTILPFAFLAFQFPRYAFESHQAH